MSDAKLLWLNRGWGELFTSEHKQGLSFQCQILDLNNVTVTKWGPIRSAFQRGLGLRVWTTCSAPKCLISSLASGGAAWLSLICPGDWLVDSQQVGPGWKLLRCFASHSHFHAGVSVTRYRDERLTGTRGSHVSAALRPRATHRHRTLQRGERGRKQKEQIFEIKLLERTTSFMTSFELCCWSELLPCVTRVTILFYP